MVDIMDMEEIFYEILTDYLGVKSMPKARLTAIKIRNEVEDFVEAEQTIACANCRGYKFKNLKERCQVG